MKKWLKENKQLFEDYQELCGDLLLFNMKWGLRMGFVFKDSKEIAGREYGKGIVEELFDTQKKVNKIIKCKK